MIQPAVRDQEGAANLRIDSLSALSELAALLESDADPLTAYRAVCTLAMRVFGGDVAALWILEASSGELVATEAIGQHGPSPLPDDVGLDQLTHPAVQAWRTRQPALAGMPGEPPPSERPDALEQSLLIPLVALGSGQSEGVVLVRRSAGTPRFDSTEVQLARVFGGLVASWLGTSASATAPAPRSDHFEVIEAMSDAVLVLGPDTRVASINDAAVELLGLRRKETLGRLASDVTWPMTDLNGQPIPAERLPMITVPRDRTPSSICDVVISAHGELKNASIEVHPMSGPRGGYAGAVVVIRDVTEYHELLQQLSRTETMRTVGQLASAAIHDINNWFGLILGQADMMLVADPPADLAEGLEAIRQAACDGAEALKRIQDLARTSPDAEPIPLDINQVLREVADITRPRWSDHSQAAGAAVSLLLDLTTSLPMISGQASELREVFTNLVLNAVDALPHGGTIKISSRKQRSRVVVTVADTGTGMTEDVAQRIFEPFFTTKGARGSGLGLSVSRTMVERHGGRVSVESEPGKGTTFTLSFRTVERAAPRTDEANVPPPPPSRILVVEDEPRMRDLLIRMLERDHHTVVACRSGREAINLLGSEIFDLILTDLVMPGIDGWEVAQAARKVQPNLPIVLVTGTSQRFTEAELRARGVEAKLSKPFHLQQLRRVLSGALKSPATPTAKAERPRLLVVDDEPAMLKMISAMLQSSGCDLEAATNGPDALTALRDAYAAGKPFGLMFTDMRMPEMDGEELIRQARTIDPRIVTVLLTGDAVDTATRVADLALQKPYSLATLLDTLDEALTLRSRVTGLIV